MSPSSPCSASLCFSFFFINFLQYGIIRYVPREACGNELSREQSLSLISPSTSLLRC